MDSVTDMAQTGEQRVTDLPSPRVNLRFVRWNLHHVINLCILLCIAGLFIVGWQALWMAVPVMLLGLLLTDGIARPGSSLFYPTITHGPRDSDCVALTFDDGPDPVMTPQVLDVLAEAGVHATFFVIGKSFADQPELAARIVREGHVVGNHSWQHARMQNFYFANWHTREIEQGRQAISAITGQLPPRLYRPPVGLKSWALGRAVWRHGLTLVAWSLHSHDTRLADPERIAARVLAKVRGGDIILMHDGHDRPGGERPYCAEALRLILRGLQRKGLKCVTVPELLNTPARQAPRGSN